jgi:putative IMPACT (imprinted ancient) family translation regulator
LGTSGLIQAYKESSADAIKNAVIIDCYVYSNVRATFEYIQLNAVMKVIKDYEIEPSEQLFDTECNMLLKIKKEKEELVLKKLKSIETLTFECLGDD